MLNDVAQSSEAEVCICKNFLKSTCRVPHSNKVLKVFLLFWSGALIPNLCSSPTANIDSPQSSTLGNYGNCVNPYPTTGAVIGRSGSAVFDSVSTPPKYGAYLQAPGVNSRIGDR